MKLSCSQIDILISFYLENELSPCLKQKFEEHLAQCKTCSEKYKIIKTAFSEMRTSTLSEGFDNSNDNYHTTSHCNILDTKISEYIDNELSNDENIKIKKFTITNKLARKELEDSYNIRRLMSDSYKKTKAEAKQDYTKIILKQLELEHEIPKEFNPAIKLLIIFTLSVLTVTAAALLSL